MLSSLKFKIFLVDDDIFSLSITEQHINNLGYYDVLTFTGGKECIEQLNLNPHIVILDHNMEGLSGIDVLKEIKRIDPSIYVVMLSGKDGKLNVDEFFRYGAFDFVTKGENEFNLISEVLNRIVEVQKKLHQISPSIN